MDIKSQVDSYGRWGFLPTCETKLPDNISRYRILIDNMRSSNFVTLVNEFKYEKSDADISTYTVPQIRYLYSVFSMMVAIYKQSQSQSQSQLQQKISIPAVLGHLWYNSAQYLGLPVVLTHASVDLYNWSFKDPEHPFMDPDYLVINHKMIYDYDEDWFYIIMISIEGLSGEFMQAMLAYNYTAMLSIIAKANRFINMLDSHCSPEIFFNKLRPFLSGHTNLRIDGIDGEFTYVGGSAAQSSFIQLIDIVLRNGKPHEGHELEFLTRMRDYMPIVDKRFLELVEQSYKPDNTNDDYIAATKEFIKFRKSHLRIVHKYITNMIEPSADKKGTGGTDYSNLLSNIIKTTQSRI